MEYCNDGIMGSGKIGQWFIGKIPLDMKIDNVNRKRLPFNPPKHYGGLKSTLQYSIIPCAGQNVRPQELPLISANYRNSETLN